MTEDEAAVLSRFDFLPDSKEFPLLLSLLVTEVLQCRQSCWSEAERVNASHIDKMLATTLNYLQFCHFKCERRGQNWVVCDGEIVCESEESQMCA